MKRRPSVLAAVAACLALSSCSAFSQDSTGPSDGLDGVDGVDVVAAFYPLQFVAQRVAGSDASVAGLTTPGQEPHDLELSVTANAELSAADLVVYEGGFQAAIDDAVDQNATGTPLDVADVVDLRTVDGEVDPHFWLDPLLLAEVGDAVARDLAEVDPTHADAYVARAADLRSDLEDLDAAFTSGLADCERSTIVVSHDAFGYLDRYGLEVAAVAGLSPDAEPTPAALQQLQRLIDSDAITTVFSEPLASPRLTASLAEDTGITTATLDPVEGLTEATADQDYLALMRANLEALRTANGCS